jgi:hypothetical protein
MWTDHELIFSEDQAITGTAQSTNVIDLAGASVDRGVGQPMRVRVTVTETFNNLTSLAFALISANARSSETLTSPVTLLTVTKTLASGLLAAGQAFDIAIPPGMQRYAALTYTVGGSNPSTGKVDARIVLDSQNNAPVPDAD